MHVTYTVIVLFYDEVKAHKRRFIASVHSSLCIRIKITELLILLFCDITSIS